MSERVIVSEKVEKIRIYLFNLHREMKNISDINLSGKFNEFLNILTNLKKLYSELSKEEKKLLNKNEIHILTAIVELSKKYGERVTPIVAGAVVDYKNYESYVNELKKIIDSFKSEFKKTSKKEKNEGTKITAGTDEWFARLPEEQKKYLESKYDTSAKLTIKVSPQMETKLMLTIRDRIDRYFREHERRIEELPEELAYKIDLVSKKMKEEEELEKFLEFIYS